MRQLFKHLDTCKLSSKNKILFLILFYSLPSHSMIPFGFLKAKPCQHGSATFSYTGSNQTFNVPESCPTLTVKAWGAGGFRCNGGGFISSTNSVTPKEVLTVVIGQAGGEGRSSFGGGGRSGGSGTYPAGAGGGGYSGLFKSNSSPIIIAGGCGGTGGPGGNSGRAGGGPGQPAADRYGGSATSSSGGAGGINCCGGTMGTSGSYLQGGSGGNTASSNYSEGGGGGGGYFGGGGGGGGGANNGGGGGGGGSSYTSGTLIKSVEGIYTADADYPGGNISGSLDTSHGYIKIIW